MTDYVSFGQKDENNDEAFFAAIVTGICVIIYIAETCCYLSFFLILYKHNNGLSILPAELKKSRNCSNAQTMMGQFYLFITEAVYMLLLFLIFVIGLNNRFPYARDIGAVYKEIEFGLVSIIQCLMIPDLRKSILKFVKGH